MSFGKQELADQPVDPCWSGQWRRRTRRRTRHRRAAATALILVSALAAALLGGVGASAADDEPDLVPFLGAYAAGCTWDNGCSNGHHGAARPALDFPMPEGTAVIAANTGVVSLWEDTCAGRYIELWHSGVRKWSRYLHLSSFAVKDGERVERGQIIGYSGNTGSDCSEGPHLHYDEINTERRRVDPGPMVGLRDGTWVSYPSALGVSGWNGLDAFFGPTVINRHTVTAAPPTTSVLSTTTIPSGATTIPSGATTIPSGPTTSTTAPPAPTSTTASTGTTTPPGTPTTAPATTTTTAPVYRSTPVADALPEGTLFRAGDSPDVFLYAAGSPWRINGEDQLAHFGGPQRIVVAGPYLDTLLSQMPWAPLEHRAFAEPGDGTIYWCAGGSPWPLSSMDELDALLRTVGTSGWSVLPQGAGSRQWACGGTAPGTVFQRRGGTAYWVWTGSGWRTFADRNAVIAAGYPGANVHLLPAV